MSTVPEEKVNVQLARLGGKKEPFEVDLFWTISDLIGKVSMKFDISKESVKLLCKGKLLNDDKIKQKTLKQMKIKKNDRLILMNKPQKKKIKKIEQPKTNNNDNNTNTTNNNHTINNNNNNNNEKKIESVDDVLNRQKNISEIKAAAEKLASRNDDGFNWNSSYYMEINNQYGDKINLPNEQRQALTVGMTLHEKGKKFMNLGQYSDAIYIMNLAFESFSKCDKKILDLIDNYGLLALDIVWCYYLNQDEKQLINAGKWLQIAEYGLTKAHGKNMERLKQIRQTQSHSNGEFIPELSLYVRLNILRSLQSFYNGQFNAAQTHLMSAEMDMRKLQISDLDLVKLTSMGYSFKESRRGLRFCNGQIDGAINYILNKRDELERKRIAEQKRLRDRAIQKKMGLTKNGKFVDLKLLEQLKGMGVEFEIAVEALRQCDNNGDETLNCCLNAERKMLLTQTLYSRHMNDQYLYKIEQIMSILGGGDIINESRVRAALFLCFNDVQDSIDMLSQPTPLQVIDLDRAEAHFIKYVQERHERIRRERELAELRRIQREKEEEERRKKQEELLKQQMEQQQQTGNDDDNDTSMNDVSNDNDADDNDDDDNKGDDTNNSNMNIDNDDDVDIADEEEEDANNDNNDNKKEEMVVDDDIKRDDNGNIVEPATIKTKAMPNPNLGDINENDDENNMDFVDNFKQIEYAAPNDDDKKIEEHIINDLDIDDEESYLDINLTKEQDAITNLKSLIASMQMQADNDGTTFLSLFNNK